MAPSSDPQQAQPPSSSQAQLHGIRRAVPFVAVAVSVLYIIGLLLGNTALAGVVSIALSVLLAILTLLVGAMAGAVVVKALFAVAAELSLLIFLTQAFCAAPDRSPANDTAMTILFSVGMVYIVYLFLSSLWDKVKDLYKRRFEDRPHNWEKFFTLASFAAFVLLFLWELYLILWPIVNGLCVYR